MAMVPIPERLRITDDDMRDASGRSFRSRPYAYAPTSMPLRGASARVLREFGPDFEGTIEERPDGSAFHIVVRNRALGTEAYIAVTPETVLDGGTRFERAVYEVASNCREQGARAMAEREAEAFRYAGALMDPREYEKRRGMRAPAAIPVRPPPPLDEPPAKPAPPVVHTVVSVRMPDGTLVSANDFFATDPRTNPVLVGTEADPAAFPSMQTWASYVQDTMIEKQDATVPEWTIERLAALVLSGYGGGSICCCGVETCRIGPFVNRA